MAADDHEFGGQHTDIKLEIVEKYLQRYSAALHTWCDAVWYIDAFAGTGSRTVRVKAKEGDLFEEPAPEYVEQRRGSAKIALDIDPPFDRLVFMDAKPKHIAALKALKASYPGRDIDVVRGDANDLIQKEIKWDGWKKTRAVMFLDPYGMEVEWDTLRLIADTKAIDVWYLFSLSGLYRQAARDMSKIDATKERALTRMLGTDAWKSELYSPIPPAIDLLGSLEREDVRQRAADVAGLERYVRDRLAQIFPKVLDPWPLPPKERPQRFSLFCAISNPSPKAIRLAEDFGRSIMRSR
ncbi:MAG: three-Cys-motif partner protein TcmP [Mesorhizobium sp.]|uniref:three-Cys-motif partner protein TcmP n=1 Tax=Mesorhizobium sp. M4A.F.Ca.ET.090.04.2.1 TaxID=2496663 RepID=UPI000FCAD876|nr:three-Cys-motif partner protein TcmP [Mesorhizobium sp. M4A.F.Ca.ET.090.04.2.1]RVC47449.1 three-Cys-motif partner protein TcmP [Mesorhizobium sp. M4A.F.Ca.ET.090.04.2.1]TIW69320.1 MAG: three-Cys-motif partner protein TcmP [Mesorhizobium sp.]